MEAPSAPSRFIGRFRWPVVVGDRVIVAYEDGVYAFPTRCGAVGVTCQPLWHAPTSFEGQPVVSQGQIIVGADEVYSYPVDCRTDGGICAPTWRSVRAGNLVGMVPGVGEGVVVVPDSPSTDDGITTITIAPSGAPGSAENRDRSPLWAGPVPYPFMPVVANGIVYVGSGLRPVQAFPVECEDPCSPAWSWAGDSMGVSTPAVESDALFVAQRDGRLLSFGIGSSTTGSGGWTKGPGFFAGTVAIVAVGVVIAEVRRRRQLEP